MTLRNINRWESENMGGNFRFYLVPVHYVDGELPEATDGVLSTSIPLVSGKKWFRWYGTLDTLAADSDLKNSNAGDYHENSLEMFVPGDELSWRQMFQDMRQMGFLLMREDNNGNFKLLGSLEEPIRFRYRFRSGDKSTDLRGYEVEFYSESIDSELFYAGTFEVEGERDPLKVCPEDVTLRMVFSDISDNEYTFTIGEKELGVFVKQTLTNVASVDYEVNGVPAPMPLYLNFGDVLTVTITRTTDFVQSVVMLSEST